jgi:hypothetical protein
MKSIKVEASPKQVSRLRNGHRVRVKKAVEGTGLNLIVDPSKFDAMSRSFAKGSAYDVQLNPDELMANKEAAPTMEGEGIFVGGKLKMGKILKGLQKAEKAVRKNPTSRAIVKKVVPLLAEKAVEGLATYAGADPATAKSLGKIGSEGSKAGLKEGGYGLFAGAQRGRGLPGPPSRMPEMSSLSIGGSILAMEASLPPAMQSDPFGANFHMNTQFNPQFQRGGVRFV